MPGEHVDVVRLEDFAGDVACYLRGSWRKGARLMVAVDDDVDPLAIETVGDLEFVHKALAWRAQGCRDASAS